jgi:hypothetical protein
MKHMLQLSQKWAPHLMSQPESGMGYQYVSVFLHDGRKFDRVTIIGGAITHVDGSTHIPFSEDEISEIRVTHDRPRDRAGLADGWWRKPR